jgi:hypothetical protein
MNRAQLNELEIRMEDLGLTARQRRFFKAHAARQWRASKGKIDWSAFLESLMKLIAAIVKLFS